MLDMKPRCERCDTLIHDEDPAYICSYECTFCATCTRWFQSRCPNCTDELVRRPRRGTEVAREAAVPLV
jgi:uncharacterized protein